MTPGNIIALCGVIITLVIAQIAEMKNASKKKHDELWRVHDYHEQRIRDIEIRHGGNGK